MGRPPCGKRPKLPSIDADLKQRLASFGEVCFVLCSARDTDMPILYTSSSFLTLTGYTTEEIVGRNCRFLHGPGTSRQKVLEIRSAIQEDRAVQVCLMNYRKSGEPFWNQFFLSPIFDSEGVVEYYLGIQTDVTEEVEAARLAHTHLHEEEGERADPLLSGEEEPSCLEAARQEEALAPELCSTVAQWRASHKGCVPRPRVQIGPAAAPCLPSSLLQPLMKLAQSFVLADPALPDCPIVYASAQFLSLSGHPRSAVVGRNCRFLQGPGTDPEAVRTIREGIAAGRPTTVRLLNYRHDGRPFWNNLHVAPVRSACGKVVFLVGVQLDITARAAASPTTAAAGAESQHHAQQAAAAAAAPAPCEGSGEGERQPGGDGHAAGEEHIVPGEPSGVELVAQRGVCGAVRVACRSLCPSSGLRRSLSDQRPVRRSSSDLVRRSSEVPRAPPPFPDMPEGSVVA